MTLFGERNEKRRSVGGKSHSDPVIVPFSFTRVKGGPLTKSRHRPRLMPRLYERSPITLMDPPRSLKFLEIFAGGVFSSAKKESRLAPALIRMDDFKVVVLAFDFKVDV